MDLPELHSRQQLRGAGYSNVDVRALLRAGALTPVRRGTYVRGRAPDNARTRHALAARAALSCLADDAVCSHVTAAVLHGLPVWRIPLDRVHVTRARRSGGRTGPPTRVHSAPLDPGEITEVAGLRVTSVARTVVDLARTVPFEDAVVVADAALLPEDPTWRRTKMASAHAAVDAAALSAALSRARQWRGTPGARWALGFADGLSESVGESRSRVALRNAGLPAPTLQWEVRGRDGRFIGHTDFGWPESCTVAEFDGRAKYGRLLRPGQDPGDAVYEEKLREDRLRDMGLSVVRWTWSELSNFAPVADRLRHHLDR